MQFFGMTDIGRVRDNNQDNFFAGYLFPERVGAPTDNVPDEDDAFLAVVCDGMGGANGGAAASRLATETFVREMKIGMEGILRNRLSADLCEGIMTYAVRCANHAVYTAANEDPELSGMGTTLVALLLFRGAAYVVNIGDSRLYIRTESGVCQLTHDHSYVQTLVDKGQLSLEEAKNHPNKNVIMRAIGTEKTVKPDFFKVLPDRKSFLLCSDGLSGFIDETDCETLIARYESTEETVKAMVRLANSRGGGDNITAVFVRL